LLTYLPRRLTAAPPCRFRLMMTAGALELAAGTDPEAGAELEPAGEPLRLCT
jgi:hypothetical protein